jgi:hypothetical protein
MGCGGCRTPFMSFRQPAAASLLYFTAHNSTTSRHTLPDGALPSLNSIKSTLSFYPLRKTGGHFSRATVGKIYTRPAELFFKKLSAC